MDNASEKTSAHATVVGEVPVAMKVCIVHSDVAGYKFNIYVHAGVCTKACVHGVCTAPDTCSCDAGWEGDSCDEGIISITVISYLCTLKFSLCSSVQLLSMYSGYLHFSWDLYLSRRMGRSTV